jgi:hypothetical protein
MSPRMKGEKQIGFPINGAPYNFVSGRFTEAKIYMPEIYNRLNFLFDSLCGLVVIVLGYRSGVRGSIPGTTRGIKK